MRALLSFACFIVLAGISATGCGKKEGEPGPSSAADKDRVAASSDKKSDKFTKSPATAPRSEDGAFEESPKTTGNADIAIEARPDTESGGKPSPASPMVDSTIPRDRPDSDKAAADKGKGWKKPASREAKAPVAMVAKVRPTKDKKNKQVEVDLPEGGRLTAGSFDDNLYPGPLRTFLNKIGRDQSAQDLPARFLGHRLVVTVKNSDGRPVGNARLQVRSEDGGPGVTLRTRTDGRAVFVSSWDEVPADGDFVVSVTPPDGGPAVVQKVAREATHCEVRLPGAAAPLPLHLDVTLVIDTTGSMGDELEYLKNEFRSIVNAINRQFPNVKQRYGLVLYRDEGDDYVTRTFPFTASLTTFRSQLAAQHAAGGGDFPEAMHKALEDAAELDWHAGNAARIVFLVADAPPHKQHTLRALKAADSLRKKGVTIYPVAASGYDPACEFVMRASALLTGGQFVFLTDDSGVGDAHGEPHIPFYQVERLNHLMIRTIASELSGRRIAPDPARIVRTVGQPPQAAAQR